MSRESVSYKMVMIVVVPRSFIFLCAELFLLSRFYCIIPTPCYRLFRTRFRMSWRTWTPPIECTSDRKGQSGVLGNPWDLARRKREWNADGIFCSEVTWPFLVQYFCTY